MKYVSTFIFVGFLLGANTSFAQIQQETQKILFSIHKGETPLLLEPGQSYEQDYTFEKDEYPMRRFFRVVGNVMMPGRFAGRGEGNFREAEYPLDDQLDSITTYKDRYALYFQGNNDIFERYAFNRVSIPQIGAGKLTVEIPVKREKLSVGKNGCFGVELYIYYKKEGRYYEDIYDDPDTIMFLPIPAGSSGFKILKKDFMLPDNVATLFIRLGGMYFSGQCWMEAPQFYQSGKKVFNMPFVPYEKRDNDYNYWFGVNLSSHSWPMWKLEYNGKNIYQGNIFDRASNIADFYIPLPADISGKGKFKLSLVKEPHKTVFPYQVRSVQLIEESARDFEIVSIPKYVAVGDTAGILLELNKPGLSLNTNTGQAIKILPYQQKFDAKGLYVINFVATAPAIDVPVEVSAAGNVRKGVVKQTMIKENDRVYLSSGDDVYIDKEFPIYDYYFKWYVRERVGNWLQFRPSYQWSGVRVTTDEFVKRYTGLLAQLRMPYAWQVDARTLAASRINTTAGTLASPMFRGKQAHENDGGYYYWQHHKYKGLFSDVRARALPFGGIYAKHRPIFTDHGTFIHYDPYAATDMADGAARFVAGLSSSRGESTRHTGPSAAFRYLYQAGYDWLGAEQMYGPDDIIMAALRGASRAYRRSDFGTLHAMQWGSSYVEPKHALRFHMSMAVAYINGSSHINTEEAIFIDEGANDRYTEPGKEHMYAQRQMMDYIETHSRQGKLNTRIAVMYGRNDAWKCFVKMQNAWSQVGDKWKFNQAMESFDLLHIFYPESVIDITGPDGWFSHTPYGPVDILPVEAPDDVLSQYKLLVFLGWNTFDNADFIRLRKFVERGGTLLLTAAHLNSELQPDAPPKFPDDDTVIKTLLGDYYRSYTTKTTIPLGKGTIIYYPQHCYPANDEIRSGYTEDIKTLASGVISGEPAKGWIEASPYIDFTIWDSDELRTLYLLNIDWKSDMEQRPATFVINGKKFTIPVSKYTIGTIRCAGPVAAMPVGNTSDILSIRKEGGKWIITCQTTGEDEIRVYNGVSGMQQAHKIDRAGLHRIEI